MPRQMEVESQEFGACENNTRASIGGRHATEQYLNESDNIKVEIEVVELLLGAEDSEVNLMKIMMNARRKKGRRIFQIFGSQGSE